MPKRKKFSGVYDTADVFSKAQGQIAEDEARFIGTVRRFHIGKGKLDQTAADALAEQLGIMQGHLFNIFVAATVLQEQQTPCCKVVSRCITCRRR